MNDINSLTITGRLTKDPERMDYADKVRIMFSVACNRSRKTKDGAWKDEVTFFSISWWRKDSSGDVPLYKGTAVCVTGQMVQYEYTAKDGTAQKAWSLEAQTVRIFAPPAQAGVQPTAAHQDVTPKKRVNSPVIDPYVNDNYPF